MTLNGTGGARRTRIAYVTNAEADIDTVHGPDAYLARLPDLHGIRGRLDVTQVVQIADNQLLAMVEIRAERGSRLFRIAAGFLGCVCGGPLTELWMVDAGPRLSGQSWAEQE